MIVEVRYVSDKLHLSSFKDKSSKGRLHKVFTLGWDEQTLQQTYFRGSASCVQNFDDSLDSAIRMTYRISLRSSSLWEPRHPLLKVLIRYHILTYQWPGDLPVCYYDEFLGTFRRCSTRQASIAGKFFIRLG